MLDYATISRPRCIVHHASSIVIVDEVDENLTALETPLGITCSKMMPQEVERHQK
jgi:hypothetical protein